MAFKDMDRATEIVNEIKKIITWYENTKFKNKKMRLFLTNKDSFIYSIPENKIAHLLGVNISNIQSLGIFNNKTSYNLLKEFVDNFYRIADSIRKDEIKFDYIFSKDINKKIDNFKKNISINLEEIAFICKYNREKTYSDGNAAINCDYSIVKLLEDGTILELDLILSVDGKFVYPVSNKMFTDEFEAEDAFERLIKNQELAIVNTMILYNNNYDQDYPVKFYLKNNQMKKKLRTIKKFVKKYNCFMDLIEECEKLYENTDNNREKNFKDDYVDETITEFVSNNKLIPMDKFKQNELSIQKIDLIDAINDRIIGNSVSDDENSESYSALRKKIEKYKKIKQELIEENKRLKVKISETEEENKVLKEDNELKTNLINSISNSFDVYNKQKNI